MNSIAQRIALIAVIFSLPSVVVGQSAWTGFQNGGHLYVPDANLPIQWSPKDGIAWKTRLAGYGQSTPVVFDDLVYVTSIAGDMKETLYVQALRLADGKEQWRYEGKNSSPEKKTNYVSLAAPTPVVDESGVIAFFEGGNVVALTHDGQVRWKVDLVEKFGSVKSRHGLGASLEQNDRYVFAWVEREQDPYVVAMTKADGNVAWKVPGVGGTSWASPRLIPVDQSSHLVLSGSGHLVGLDPATGKRLWEFDQIAGNTTQTPVPLGDGKFLVGSSPGRGESVDEAKSNGLIQVIQENGHFHVKWIWKADRASCSFGSPIAHAGLAWFVNRQGVLYGLDLEDGSQEFLKRLPAKSIWATPIATDDRIYFFGKDGATSIVQVRSNEEIQIQATNELWTQEPADPTSENSSQPGEASVSGPVLYAAVPLDTRLLIRRGDFLYAVGQ